MKNWMGVLISPTMPIIKAIQIIDHSALQIALVVDENRKLMGTVTDGDVRRGILRGVPLENPVQHIMNRNPTVVNKGENRERIIQVMNRKGFHHLPVVDENGCVIGLEILDEILRPHLRENWVVLMAGGLGSRLHPLTEDCPKPLLKIGGKPILEIILENLKKFGFYKFFLSVNYKAKMVEEYFGDGSRWGVEIYYIHEVEKMGTAGALGLLFEKPKHPILVMNGDLLTKINYRHLLEFHLQHEADATMCIREYKLQIPYGIVKIDKDRLVGINEKPFHSFFINAGIYVIGPDVIDVIPKNKPNDMPTIFQSLIRKKYKVASFPVREYWLDIGHIDDYKRANMDYINLFM